MVEFKGWPKIHRLSRECIITEKIDGTNACVVISDDGKDGITICAQSRTRLITPENDNFGFAQWVKDHIDELVLLGPGHHFGEWWGKGIQRGYGLRERRFSLFNILRWEERDLPKCCHLVPVLSYKCLFDTKFIEEAMQKLLEKGSRASPGFMDPEGIVIYHVQGNVAFKKTFEGDSEGKG